MRRRLSFGSAAEMVQSSSDDQLYRGKRRQSVYSGSSVRMEKILVKLRRVKGNRFLEER